MAYKRVRGWTSGQSLPVLNFVKYPPSQWTWPHIFTVPQISSTCCLKIMSQDELHVHVPTIKTSTDIMDWENLILFLRLRNFRVQLQGK